MTVTFCTELFNKSYHVASSACFSLLVMQLMFILQKDITKIKLSQIWLQLFCWIFQHKNCLSFFVSKDKIFFSEKRFTRNCNLILRGQSEIFQLNYYHWRRRRWWWKMKNWTFHYANYYAHSSMHVYVQAIQFSGLRGFHDMQSDDIERNYVKRRGGKNPRGIL
jgi:hypothetical protein